VVSRSDKRLATQIITKEAHMSSVPTVLIVDDSRLSRMMIRAFITQAHPDWAIVEASNGSEALEKTATLTVDLMTIDLNMPGMDGLTLATQLQHTHPTAPIALVEPGRNYPSLYTVNGRPL
jgi:CheY-like chemotaxis protein